MPSITETTHSGAFLIKEFSRDYNRETVTIASGQSLAAGAVVGKVTASGKYAAYDDGAADGTEDAAGILYAAVDASGGDAEGLVVLRGPAVVNKAELVFDSGQDATAQANAIADLAALNIISR